MKKTGIYLGMAALTLLSATGGTMVHAATGGTTSPQTTAGVTMQAPTTGALTLDTTKLPQKLDFSAEINYDKAMTDADGVATTAGGQTGPTDVHIEDMRGTSPGYSLKVAMSEFVLSSDNTKKLDGATMTIKPGNVQSSAANNPITSGQQEVTLDSVNAGTLLNVATGQGDGVADMSINKYILHVPGASKKEAASYSSTLTWTLSDTPTQP